MKRFIHKSYKGYSGWDSFIYDSEGNESFVGNYPSKLEADLNGKNEVKFLNSKINMKKKKNSAVRMNPVRRNMDMRHKNPTMRIYNGPYGEVFINYSNHEYKVKTPDDVHLTFKLLKQAQHFADTGKMPSHNPKKRKNASIHYANNPLHFPRTAVGRPRKRGRPSKIRAATTFPRGKGRLPKIKFWLLDLYNSSGKLVHTLVGQGAKSNAELEAQKFASQRGVARVELAGPYSSRPSKTTPRI